jgi:hypothetical protein
MNKPDRPDKEKAKAIGKGIGRRLAAGPVKLAELVFGVLLGILSKIPEPNREAAKASGRGIGRGLVWLPIKSVALLVGVLLGILSKIPKREAIYQKMISNGVEQLYKQTDAAVIVMTIYGDGAVIPRPAEIDREDGIVRTNNDEEWTLTDLMPCRMGDAPVVWGVADDHELASPVAARVAEAVDLDFWGRTQPIEEGPDGVSAVDYQSPQQAIADGGEEALSQSFDDVLADARNPLDDATGWIVSMRKGYELHWSQSASDEMKKQEDRGRLAEMDPDKYRKQAMKVALLLLGAVALGLFGPSLAAQIAGGASGASGGVSVGLTIGNPTVEVLRGGLL